MNPNKVNIPVSFLHIREHVQGKDGKMTVVSNGGATIGWMKTKDEVHYTVAKCKNTDTFNRRIGRTITTNRLIADKDVHKVLVPENCTREFIRAKLLDEYYSLVYQHIPNAPERYY